ncbi:nuclear transport factor 2 family protein [Aminobacter sp. LjRoot7]|uniref:nuclear transport factor 2 family protein n=1 Tax=Aminobacter sp. LjRoot7 TaxID=3342335 RepID=UPI003ECCFAAB
MLEARLARAEAMLDIIALEARYARAWDSGDGAAWADVFTADGVFEIAAVGDRPAQKVEGRDQLAAFCLDFTSKYSGVHVPGLPLLDIDSDKATGHLHFQFVAIGRLAPNHTMSRTACGQYDVRYRRTDEGWRMAHRLEKAFSSARSEFFDF